MRARELDEKEQGLLFLEVQLEETSVELERREVALGMSGRCSNCLGYPVQSSRAGGYGRAAVQPIVTAETQLSGCANGQKPKRQTSLNSCECPSRVGCCEMH